MDHTALFLFFSALVVASALLGAVMVLAAGKPKTETTTGQDKGGLDGRLASLESRLEESQKRLSEKDAQIEILKEKLEESTEQLSRMLNRVAEMIGPDGAAEADPALSDAQPVSSPRNIRKLLSEIEKTRESGGV